MRTPEECTSWAPRPTASSCCASRPGPGGASPRPCSAAPSRHRRERRHCFNTIHVALGGVDLVDTSGPGVIIELLGLFFPWPCCSVPSCCEGRASIELDRGGSGCRGLADRTHPQHGVAGRHRQRSPRDRTRPPRPDRHALQPSQLLARPHADEGNLHVHRSPPHRLKTEPTPFIHPVP